MDCPESKYNITILNELCNLKSMTLMRIRRRAP